MVHPHLALIGKNDGRQVFVQSSSMASRNRDSKVTAATFGPAALIAGESAAEGASAMPSTTLRRAV